MIEALVSTLNNSGKHYISCSLILKARRTSIACRIDPEWSGQCITYVTGTFQCYWYRAHDSLRWRTLSRSWGGHGSGGTIRFDGDNGTWAVTHAPLWFLRWCSVFTVTNLITLWPPTNCWRSLHLQCNGFYCTSSITHDDAQHKYGGVRVATCKPF